METYNKYQTQLTEELLATLPQEVVEQLFEFINTVPFIRNCIREDKPKAKDLKRDSKGRIIVDVTKPHILENMDYFRQAAIFYQKNKCYTFLKPNPNPNSEYGKWIRQERDRCWNGMVRESDGEWITGYMYFYLNYSPIIQSKIRKGSKIADRVIDFPEVWEGVYYAFHYIDQMRNGGLYNEFKGGQHGAELARRGASKSYMLGSMAAHNFIFGENKESNKEHKTIITTSKKEYLVKDGTLNKFMSIIDYCASYTEFPRRRLKESIQEMTWIMGYKDAETNIARGTQNTVIGVAADEESKLRGKRGHIYVDEFGSFPKLSKQYNVWLPSVQEGDIVFGMIFLVGTAGDKESDFQGAQELMYNPNGYNLYALPNVYDKETQGKKRFVYFFPAYLNRKGCYDKDGNSDVIKAIIEILLNRYRVKHNSSDPATIATTIAENPITPAEAIIKTGVNIFPVTELGNRLAQLDNQPNLLNEINVGSLVQNGNQIEFKPDNSVPIRDYYKYKNDGSEKLDGAIEIIVMPENDRNTGKPFSGRYIAGLDPYENDKSDESTSLGSMFVFDLFTDNIVAEYTGRPMFAEDYYENVRKLCMFYNATLNYENNKKGIFAYFSKMNCLYLLSDTLDYLRDKLLVKCSTFGNTSKGTNATQAVNNYALTLIRNWLLKPDTVTNQDLNGNPVEVSIPHLYTLRNRALLRELMLFNPNDGNYDRVSALGMLMLLREDRIVAYGGNVKPDDEIDKDYLGNDDFFTRNYDIRFKVKLSLQ